MTVVLDSSVTLAWLFTDETTEAVRRVFDNVATDGAVVPSLWRLEVANVLNLAIRRKRITMTVRATSLRDLSARNILVDPLTDLHAWGETLALADRFGLTPYDAAYLELAERRDLPLATLDEALRVAATALRRPVLGL